MKTLLEMDLTPSKIITRKSIENALTIVMALGGSTNAVLHYLAIAHAADVPLTYKDIQEISDRTPLIADFKPSGKYYMEEVLSIGGLPAIMKYLMKKGLIHGDCLTISGKTVAENLADVPDLDFE